MSKPPNPTGKGGFEKGKSGNAAGRPKETEEDKATKIDVIALARKHTVAAMEVLIEVMQDPDATAASRVSAANYVLERGWGKAPQVVVGDHNGGPVKLDVSTQDAATEAARVLAFMFRQACA